MKHICTASLLLSTAIFWSCGDDANVTDAGIDAAPPSGTFSLSWTLIDGDNTLECADVGALTVSVALVQQGGFNGGTYPFSCDSASGTSGPVPPGVYNATIDVRAAGTPTRSLLDMTTQIQGVTITDGSDTPLGAHSFTIEPVGSFTFYVDHGGDGGNCDTDGGDISGLVFELENADGDCVEAGFAVEGGDTYQSSCTSPPVGACFGKSAKVQVTGVASGAYSLTITGQKDEGGPIDCYSRVSNFTVAGNNLVTDVGSLGLQLEYSAACDPNYVPPDAGIADAGVPDAI